MGTNSKLSINLRVERVKKGLTQQEVADYLGVKQQTYSKYEKGSPVDDDILVKLCRLYDISSDELLGLPPKPSMESQSYQLNNEQLNEIVKKVLNQVEGEKKNG